MVYRRRPTDEEWEIMMDRQGGVCPYCGDDLSNSTRYTHVDHKRPLIRGGSNSLRNMQLTCKECNLEKGDMTDREYRDFLESDDDEEDYY